MDGKTDRTFRISASEKFTEWPGREFTPSGNADLFKIYIDPQELTSGVISQDSWFGGAEISDDGSYVSIYPNTKDPRKEAYVLVFSNSTGEAETGKYLVFKYRVPATNTESTGNFEFFTSTGGNIPAEGDQVIYTPKTDGEWHVIVVDLSMAGINKFKDTDGKYCAQYMRFDIFNKEVSTEGTHVDIAYVGIHDNLEDICALEKDNFEKITLIEGGSPIELITATCKKNIKTYFAEGADFTRSEVAFGARLDYISGVFAELSSTSIKGMSIYSSATVSKELAIGVAGWCGVDGGVNKYVYSTDGGLTWIDVESETFSAGDAIVNTAQGNAGVTFKDFEASRKNGAFQAGGIKLDLSHCKGETVNVLFAAVPETDQDAILLLFCFEDVVCIPEPIFANESEYQEASLPYGAFIDSANGVAIAVPSGTATGYATINKSLNVDPELKLWVGGWCAVDGGVQKYLWTADNGVTWNECGGNPNLGYSDLIEVGQKNSGSTFTDCEGALNNCSFQSSKIMLDLSAYENEDKLTVFIVALPTLESDAVCPLFKLTDVSMTPVAPAE